MYQIHANSFYLSLDLSIFFFLWLIKMGFNPTVLLNEL
jgi:hypothetical protein